MSAPSDAVTITRALELEPLLCDHGLLDDGQRERVARRAGLPVVPRADTLNPESVAYCVDFLSAFTPLKQPRHPGSYTMKHVAENLRGRYVSNGELIAGAVLTGLPYRRHDDSPNVALALPVAEVRYAEANGGGYTVGRWETQGKPPGWDVFVATHVTE